MKILHITPHLGGGVGTVIMDWLERDINRSDTWIYLLDGPNEKSRCWANRNNIKMAWKQSSFWLTDAIAGADVVIVHYWDHPLLKELFSRPIPPCRLAFWCHKNVLYHPPEILFPDVWMNTSPVQMVYRDNRFTNYIWSTGDISRFLEIKPKPHEGFNIGYVGTISYKKIHPEWYLMCEMIKKLIPEARFTFVGENLTAVQGSEWMTFVGKVDDVAPYLAEMDVFGYPLRSDHYGTCEQVLGEAMAAGVVPIVLGNPAEKHILRQNLCCVASSPEDYVLSVCQAEELIRSPWYSLFIHFLRKGTKEIYSIDTMISQWNKTFEEMMSNPKKDRRPL